MEDKVLYNSGGEQRAMGGEQRDSSVGLFAMGGEPVMNAWHPQPNAHSPQPNAHSPQPNAHSPQPNAQNSITIDIPAAVIFECLCRFAATASGVNPEEKARNARSLLDACLAEYKDAVAAAAAATIKQRLTEDYEAKILVPGAGITAERSITQTAKALYLPPLPEDRREKAIADAARLVREIESAKLLQEGENDFAEVVAKTKKIFPNHVFCDVVQLIGVGPGANGEEHFYWIAAVFPTNREYHRIIFVGFEDEICERGDEIETTDVIPGIVEQWREYFKLPAERIDLTDFIAAVEKFKAEHVK